MKQKLKKLWGIIKVYLCMPVYCIDRWVYLHLVEHDGLYLKVHKSFGRDLQEELDTAIKIRENRKLEGEYRSIFYYSLDWGV